MTMENPRNQAPQPNPAPTQPETSKLPWLPGVKPLMLAPMQGLTNRALRSLFTKWVRPDVVWTEFMRVNPVSAKKRLMPGDLREISASEDGIPLVVQLIGHGREALVSAAKAAQDAGAEHLNLNMGCPYGRMTSGLTGGGMLKKPELLEEIIPALREAIHGSFSIKLRAGYEDPQQVFSLLPLFERSGVDFLVLHPRTVRQAYNGWADHDVTAEVVCQTSIPVIANGDIRSAGAGLRLLEQSGAAGLMLGRGGIGEPMLFERLRGRACATPDLAERKTMLHRYLSDLLPLYCALFCGDAQVLGKIKGVVSNVEDAELERELKKLTRSKTLQAFRAALEDLAP
ncbi:tRNA-dihydrouridine synthase Ava_2169 [Citrifermentans bremense]|uniref:tRNA-dihydrouridine synthase n=1 Tax=Citrifermentans bremense TaxID=60035 RepID=A0A6S6M229_9BACT|nr:tRNA-dihydrouridine synthase family protein [Citrifermentans bremense]BCG45345.1 tRNA-dihydrouridine synthase Ava_2169 [Citrifermentans bremense]